MQQVLNAPASLRNVTVSGLPGSGSSTLANKLAQLLGWKIFSGGDFMRAWAVKHGCYSKDEKLHHPATAYGDEFDREVDWGMRRDLMNKDRRVIDAWLAGFMAQGVPGVLKILTYCSDDAVRVDRIVNRDKVSVEEAKRHIFAREQQNTQKWRRMYRKEWQEWVGEHKKGKAAIDFWNPNLYDVVIDTFACDREETLKRVARALGRW